MKRGYLSEYFVGIGFKRLSAVEAPRKNSNQHEFGGSKPLVGILGTERRIFQGVFVYLSDSQNESLRAYGDLTWYDARENQPHRSPEFRLYYSDNDVTNQISAGDLLVVGRRQDNTLLVLIVAGNSTVENQILWLFGINDLSQPLFSVKDEKDSDAIQLQFASRYILDQIGIEADETDENFLEQMLNKFGGKFPTTRVFSDFARSTLKTDNTADPDSLVLLWLEREEILFRTLERHLIGDRLQTGFAGDIDAFIKFSLSVQNRRKSRAGTALENHLEYLFSTRNVRFRRAAVTEGRSKPDFLFPGEKEYCDKDYPPLRLTMLGVKSSCKDRWRQILAEADRIERKHLLTLEPGISLNQTQEMVSKGVQLVLPKQIHGTYRPVQQDQIMDVSQFLELVLARQG